MAFSIDNLNIKTPILLAPMAGITDFPFRSIVRKCGGAGLMFSEMLASKVSVDHLRKKKLKELTDYTEEFPLAVQIAGCEPEIIAEAARIAESKGATIIDLNMGCPVKKIVNKLGGSALMRDETLAAKIMEQTVKAVKIPVTVKMRLGWDEKNKNAVSLAKIAEDCGIKMITVHGRTREQLFSGKSNWKEVGLVKSIVKIPVIVNGDILSNQDASQALKNSNADGIMIGRGCCGKPWITSQIAEYLLNKITSQQPSTKELQEIIIEHYELMLSYYGEHTGMMMARKHLGWYLENTSITKEILDEIKTSSEPQKVISLIKNNLN